MGLGANLTMREVASSANRYLSIRTYFVISIRTYTVKTHSFYK